MLAAPFYMGMGIYGFYAAQPYLLELFGDQQAIGDRRHRRRRHRGHAGRRRLRGPVHPQSCSAAARTS